MVAMLVLTVGAAGASAASKHHKAKPKVKVSVNKVTRTSALKSGLSVKVTSPGKATIKVSVGSSYAKSVSVKFKKRGSKTVRLKLATKGKTKLGACGKVKVKVSVTATYKGKKYKASRTLSWTGPACPIPPVHVVTTNADRCDPLGYGECLTPFPDNFYTVADKTTATGLRVNMNRASMPANNHRVTIDPTEWNRADGFSLAGPIDVQIPGLQSKAAFTASKIVPVTDLAQYARADQPVVLIDATTHQRFPIWAEMDANAAKDADRMLEIHPSKALDEGHRYIVALRNLKTASGAAIPPSAIFKDYRDKVITDNAAVEGRRAKMESIFATLGQAGITRSTLNLAWDFTVASEGNVTGRALQIRDKAFATIGDTTMGDGIVNGTAPHVTITQVINHPDNTTDNDNEYGARQVAGTVTVPCYLTTPNCAPGGSFNYAADGKTIVQNGTTEAPFHCIIPRSSLNGPMATGTRAVIYGHGLFGSGDQGWRSNKVNDAYKADATVCAPDFAGMASEDVDPTTINIIMDLSKFKQLADRTQQGLLNFMFVGRAMVAGGMQNLPAFQNGDGTTTTGTPVIDTSKQLAYFGISEGGILGGSLTALEPDSTNSVLNSPGMAYGTLLPRSTDFAEFAQLLYPSYPDQRSRPLLFSLLQMLWDRSEASGYSHHMTTNPLPNTPPHRVLMQTAFGDMQVANVTAQMEARTLGLSTRTNVLYPGRSTEVTPFWGIPQIGAFPAQTSGITVWDAGPPRLSGSLATQDEVWTGNDQAPDANVASVERTNGHFDGPTYVPAIRGNGEDPHDIPGNTPITQQQLADFLNTGSITDTCIPGKPCYLDGYTGP
jgi:hypothetical protein